MIGVILAGGYAIRLYPLTKNLAKPLLQIGEKPVIDYIIEKLLRVNEINRVIITTNEKFEHQFKEWLSHRWHHNIELKIEKNCREEDKLGALRAIEEIVRDVNDEDYMIIAGDNIFSSDLTGIVKTYQDMKAPIVGVYNIKDRETAKNFSIIKMNMEQRIISFEEKPARPKSTMVGTCIYIFPRKSLKRIHEYLNNGNNPDSPGHFIEWLCKRERIQGYVLQGYWYDIGTSETYQEAKKHFQVKLPITYTR